MRGFLSAPRMVLCGRPVAIIGGHMGYFGGEVTGENEVRALTRQLIKEGADYIKIVATGGTTRTSFPTLAAFNVDELRAVTDEARKFGKLTATHSSSTAGIANSLDAGVDMIIHCYYLDADGTVNFREDIAERIERQDAFVNPTLQVSRATAWELTHKRDDNGLTASEQSALEVARRNLDVRLDHTRRMIEMGVKVITGSDSSWSSYRLGNTPYETELLVHAGYTPMQGVLSVTGWAADALGRIRPRWHARTRQDGGCLGCARQPCRRHKRPVECGGRLSRRSPCRSWFRRSHRRHPPTARAALLIVIPAKAGIQ